MREKILFGGDTNTGKTLAIFNLALSFPNSKVVAFDAEGDLNLTIEEIGVQLPNLTVFNVKPDWMAFEKAYGEAKKLLTPEDWMSFDMMGVFWDLAQGSFAQMVFGESLAQHQLALLQERKKIDFGGFDGLQHWPTIKKMHNEDIFDDAVRWSDFNVFATTSLGDFSPKEKIPKFGIDALMASEFGKKLEGEKHNRYRFRTIVIGYYKPAEKKYYFKIVKQKGKEMETPLPEYDFTGKSFIDVYLRARSGNDTN